jgi:hypothetical protein
MIRALTAAAILLSAFLLFQIQPILARFALPWYGGSAAVWGACMLFFQALLFLGYLYAHWLNTRLSPGAQGAVHVALLVASLFLLPIVPAEHLKPTGDDDPMLGVLALLTVTVGLPYFLLSSTSPLAQAWLLRVSPSALPYRFYALSNFASLAGLLAYPFVVERLWTLREQAVRWSAGYAVFVAAMAAFAWLVTRKATDDTRVASSRGPSVPPGAETVLTLRVQLEWIALAALPSALSLSVTNHLTQNVASIPLLWIVPLAIYLLTLMLCFDSERWYRRRFYVPASLAALFAAGVLLIRPDLHTVLELQLPAFAVVLFVLAMSLHGELVLRRPGGDQLTRFYLLMSLGGALGGLSIGLGAPYLLKGYYELPLALSACAVAMTLLGFHRHFLVGAASAPFAIWLFAASAAFIGSSEGDALVTTRNFYGGLRVLEHRDETQPGPWRDLVHGAIVHGSQFLDPTLRREPTAYYARGSGADWAIATQRSDGGGEAGARQLQHTPRRALRIGIVGLGVGAMAAYGEAGDLVRYYELNPEVITLAREYFTFLGDSPASVETVAGDGRLSLERERDAPFDVLAIDAFSGDSIPVHLLSLEAFRLYFSRLTDGGVLGVHVTNAVLDLRPVLAAAAHALGRQAYEVHVDADDARLRGESSWVLMVDRRHFRGALPADVATPIERRQDFRVWTDDYSNLLAVLR